MKDEPERPYHIQAVYDLKDNYSPEHFRYEIRVCREAIAQVVAEDNRSDQQTARVHILRYLDLLLSRAVAWIDGEADLLAIVLRSAIELRGWAELVSESLERATKFLNDDVVIDAHELNEQMRKAFPGAASLPHVPTGKRKDPPRIGQRVDYDFKLCSKLIHPSALMLNHPELTIRKEDDKAYLAVEVLFYAWLIRQPVSSHQLDAMSIIRGPKSVLCDL